MVYQHKGNRGCQFEHIEGKFNIVLLEALIKTHRIKENVD